MRGLTFLLAATAVCIAANHSPADDKIRLAQTGNVTTCMMQCNSQAANCQTTCLIPAPPPTPGTTHERAYRQDEHRGKHGVPDDMQLDTDLVSDHLRQAIPFAIAFSQGP